ncbi:hypothetical protein [Pseudomonas turukhanskensis]|uniref:Uncharacterized protein n=1 Tax=Pseudomonas turukhanskensis TaxID=1806536 RepID=A0A9W6NGM6_9PSED|nr:hypothetical protein [Pseudomonas turukhanskensis]GLK89997.1 hypothetical protein GCM10017655_30590 [Pseudomonas turukhanskensis]
MNLNWRNSDKTYAACPVLTDCDVAGYVKNGSLPADRHYLEVPAMKVVRNRGFWLKPSYRCHADATVFLVSTDAYEMNSDALEGMRGGVYCFFSEKSGVHYLGRVNRQSSGGVLLSLIEGLHDPLVLHDLNYLGRVIAAA